MQQHIVCYTMLHRCNYILKELDRVSSVVSVVFNHVALLMTLMFGAELAPTENQEVLLLLWLTQWVFPFPRLSCGHFISI